MSARAVLDVSALPTAEHGRRALVWLGQVWMLVIEGTMFALAFASYFYLRATADVWPPANVELPGLAIPTVMLALFLATIVPTRISSRAADEEDAPRLVRSMVVLSVLELVAVALWWVYLSRLGFRWYDYAYGSAVWLLLGIRTFHLVVSTAETVVLTTLAARGPVTRGHYLATKIDGMYWYWVIGWFIAIYLVVDLLPRV